MTHGDRRGSIADCFDPGRMLADLDRLRAFGATGTGVVRPALSSVDVQSRDWLASRYRDAGLEAVTDRCGNVFGCDAVRPSAILIGSHADTQVKGGWLDGALGVIYGLEIARAAKASGRTGRIGVDAVAWNDEEGRFTHFTGSRAYAGKLSIGEYDTAVDADGIRLADAVVAAGYGDLPLRPVSPSRHVAYLEGHIEQGPLLETTGLQLAAVDGIVGAKEYLVTYHGEANHAGTAPMALRHDAVRAMIAFVSRLEERFAALADDHIVWTFGRITVEPNAPSIVPAAASISVQFRSSRPAMLERFAAAVHQTVDEAGGVAGCAKPDLAQILDYVPTPMDLHLTHILHDAAQTIAPGRSRIMSSGAGHDAQFMAPLMPTGMLFVPSIGGISHSFDEDTARGDLVAGCRALALAVDRLLTEIDPV